MDRFVDFIQRSLQAMGLFRRAKSDAKLAKVLKVQDKLTVEANGLIEIAAAEEARRNRKIDALSDRVLREHDEISSARGRAEQARSILDRFVDRVEDAFDGDNDEAAA